MIKNRKTVISGIYAIVNEVNGHFYIGSSKNVVKRWYAHRSALRSKKHHCIYLQRAVNKSGLSNFNIYVIEKTRALHKREKFFIAELEPEYNIGSVGGGDNTSMHPNNDEIRKKISKSQTGRKGVSRYGSDNPNWRGGRPSGRCSKCGIEIPYQNMSGFCKKHFIRCGEANPFWKKTHSAETKKKMSKANKGKMPVNCRRVRIGKITYPSVTEASRQLNVSAGTVIFRIKSKYFLNYSYRD